jgi:general L-amino acid transport system substrate-binding protein
MSTPRRLLALLVASLAAWLAPHAAARAQRTDGDAVQAIRARGELLCGIGGVTGFAVQDGRTWRGFNADYCRAIAAALLGSATKVRFVEVPRVADAFAALAERRIDVSVSDITMNLTRAREAGVAFPVVIYYDGQAFLVPRSIQVTTASQLQNARICVAPGSVSEGALADYFATMRMRYTEVLVSGVAQIRNALRSGDCVAFSGDGSDLPGIRLALGNPLDYVVLPEVISKSPLAPAVRRGERDLEDVVRWTHFALLSAEEYGLSQATLDAMRQATDARVRRMLGGAGDVGRPLGLDKDWIVDVIRDVGNYADIWTRNLTPVGLERRLNALWTEGGLQYAPSIQ